MATIKFSGFDNEAVDATNTQLVGYKTTDLTHNFRYTIAQLATALSPSIDNFYTADGTIGTTRIVKVTDTVTFQNAGGTISLFSLNTDGTFTLGAYASVHSSNAVAIGTWALATGSKGVCMGAYSSATALNSIGIGYDADSTADYAMTWGGVATNSGANSILLCSDGATKTLNSDANSLKIHVNSHLWPDFSIIGGVSKFAFDADSFSTLTVADASHTTLATGESGNLTLDAAGDLTLDADSGVITFADGGVSLATIATLRTESFIVACSDETTVLATGANPVATFRMPYAFTLTAVRASLTTAGTTSGLTTIDINLGGSSIFTTDLLTIDFGDKTSVGATTPPNITTTALTSDGEITIDIDAISGGATETGLKVTLIGYQTV